MLKDLNKLRDLITEYRTIDPRDDDSWNKNHAERLAILSENLQDTIEFLDTCNRFEFRGVMDLFEDLSRHFQSKEFIDAIERCDTRFSNFNANQYVALAKAAYKEHKSSSFEKGKLDELIRKSKGFYLEGDNETWNKNLDEIIEILSKDLKETIKFLDQCSLEEFEAVHIAFPDINDKFHSKEFLECIERNDLRYPQIDASMDRKLATDLMTKNKK